MPNPPQSALRDLETADYVPETMRAGVRELLPVLYEDLRRLAHSQRRRLPAPHTLGTTALVHEAYLKLHDQPAFASHAEFLKVAAVTMRHLLIDRVRAQHAAKRGGDAVHLALEDADGFVVEDADTVLEIHEALLRLAEVQPRLAQVVECRYFGGYTDAEIAEALGVTERTVRRDWVAARAWLARELGPGRDALLEERAPGD